MNIDRGCEVVGIHVPLTVDKESMNNNSVLSCVYVCRVLVGVTAASTF